MPWYRKVDGEVKPGEEKKEGLEDVEFKPEKLKEDITKDLDTKFTAFSTAQDEKLKPLLTMAENIERDRVARETAAKKAAEKKEKDDNAVTDEDFLLNPADATRRIMQEGNTPIVTATKMMLAKSNLRDTMDNKEYYHGDIKVKVDAMVANQPLDMQCRADVVENCYKSIVFDHLKDINEGKIKARTSSMNFDASGTGGHAADSKDTPETMTEDEKKAASAMGIKNEEWIKSRRELTFV